LFPEEASFIFYGFENRLYWKSNNVVVFPPDFHIVAQQPFKPLWSHLLLYNHEPCRASFVLGFKSLLVALLLASEKCEPEILSPRHLSLSVSYPFDLSGLVGPTSGTATAGLAVRVTGNHKPLHRGKVEIPSGSVVLEKHGEGQLDRSCEK
jgi:hypothetical protein